MNLFLPIIDCFNFPNIYKRHLASFEQTPTDVTHNFFYFKMYTIRRPLCTQIIRVFYGAQNVVKTKLKY